MANSRNVIIFFLSIAVLTLGYYYYQSRQNVVEIKLPSIKIEKR